VVAPEAIRDPRGMRALVIAVIAVLAATAAADPARVAGFITAGTGQLSGRVVDLRGKPVKGARVHIAPETGKEQIVTTDGDGRYRAELTGGTYTYVFVHGELQIEGQAAVATTEGDVEAIEIREALAPAVQPRPKTNSLAIQEYSKTAIDRNAWVRAWFLLDVDATGAVTRVKMLNRPGYDLDAIAMKAAFGVKFEPARDRADRPTRAMVVWSFEWPAYWWMRQNKHDPRRIPAEALNVPCLGSGPTRSVYRDCATPNIAAAVSQPWRDKP
jgi:hypothetical protein